MCYRRQVCIVESVRPGMEKRLESVLIEARASIIWGKPLSEVRDTLRSAGLSQAEVEFVLKTCTRERAAEIRRIGLRDLMVGGAVLILASLPFAAVHFGGVFHSRMVAGSVLLAVYGLWRAGKGIDKLMSGARMHGSVTDM